MAISGIAAIPALKEVYTQLKTRMDKAVEDFRKAMAAIAPSVQVSVMKPGETRLIQT